MSDGWQNITQPKKTTTSCNWLTGVQYILMVNVLMYNLCSAQIKAAIYMYELVCWSISYVVMYTWSFCTRKTFPFTPAEGETVIGLD